MTRKYPRNVQIKGKILIFTSFCYTSEVTNKRVHHLLASQFFSAVSRVIAVRPRHSDDNVFFISERFLYLPAVTWHAVRSARSLSQRHCMNSSKNKKRESWLWVSHANQVWTFNNFITCVCFKRQARLICQERIAVFKEPNVKRLFFHAACSRRQKGVIEGEVEWRGKKPGNCSKGES